MDLPLLTALFLVFALSLYVMLDGFDLGVGALLLLEPDEKHRDRMIDAIAPTWDGNETWLIMAGVAMLAGFPTAYSVLMPAFYVPLVVMLLSLGLRGVSFEFRYQTITARRRWDAVFSVGSIIAAFCQGAVVGGLLVGVAVENGAFVGGTFDWLKPLPILCGVTSLTGYAMLGAGWLYLKGDEKAMRFAAKQLRVFTPVFMALSTATVLFTYLLHPQIAEAWNQQFWIIGILAVTYFWAGSNIVVRAFRQKITSDFQPFLSGLLMFGSALVALVLTVAPNIVPFRISLWEAASPRTSQIFLLIGVLFVTPVVIAYSAFSYWVFRGKTPKEGWGE